MPEYAQYFTTSAGSHLNNRCIFTGPQTNTPWPVPKGTTEVHVHVWGGGGAACQTPLSYGRGGGGGGYARTSLIVDDTDSLSITVGGNAGTSSVTVPTQTPGSPITALGGGNGSENAAGAGGTGNVVLSPHQCSWYCYTATGGNGGISLICTAVAGGGAAGSPRGTGGNGAGDQCGSGGGIGGSPGLTYRCFNIACNPNGVGSQQTEKVYTWNGGSALQARQFSGCDHCAARGLIQRPYSGIPDTPTAVTEFGAVGCSRFTNSAFITEDSIGGGAGTPTDDAVFTCYDGNNSMNKSMDTEWFYVEDMAGASNANWQSPMFTHNIPCSPSGAGAGAAIHSHGTAGVLGGGGCSDGSSTPGSNAGCAGGSGSAPAAGVTLGTPGMVIIYW